MPNTVVAAELGVHEHTVGKWRRRFVQESGNGGNGTHTVERRLAALETHIQYLATREDIEKLKNSLLEKDGSRDRWLIGVLIAAILSISLAVIRTFFS